MKHGHFSPLPCPVSDTRPCQCLTDTTPVLRSIFGTLQVSTCPCLCRVRCPCRCWCFIDGNTDLAEDFFDKSLAKQYCDGILPFMRYWSRHPSTPN
ncbi:hypothetical protein GLYMA_07G135250v4 [Glycine max]|nr:hypothetical protein GLYMA_07G135250v4 [Glycine max]KAH1086735.1 hypothetical protein GYH30_018301 [Glycine max]